METSSTRFHSFALLGLLCLVGCAPAVYYEGFDEEPEVVREGLRHALTAIDWEYDEAPVKDGVPKMAWFLRDIPYESETWARPGFLVYKRNSNPLNKTESFGIAYIDSADGGGTAFSSCFESEGGDALANAMLVTKLTRHDIALSRELAEPTVNPQKSGFVFVATNTLSPILSTKYVLNDNPLYTPKRHKIYYLLAALGDVVAGGVFAASRLEDDPKQRRMLGNVAIGIAAGYRLLCLLNFNEIGDYNQIARSHYDVRAIKKSYAN